MTITLAQIGNSQGIRIPQTILKEVMFTDQANIEIKNNKIIITPTKKARHNWNQQFQNSQKEELLFPDIMSHGWDQEEWQW